MPESDCRVTKDEVNADLIRRLRRVEGQIRGVQRMVQENRECADILSQLSAVNEAVRRASLVLAEQYALECLDGSKGKGDKSREAVTTLIDALLRAPR